MARGPAERTKGGVRRLLGTRRAQLATPSTGWHTAVRPRCPRMLAASTLGWTVVTAVVARSSGTTRAVSSRSRRGRLGRTVPNCAQHTAVSAVRGGAHARPTQGGIDTELLVNSVHPATPSAVIGSRRGVGSIGITCRDDNHTTAKDATAKDDQQVVAVRRNISERHVEHE